MNTGQPPSLGDTVLQVKDLGIRLRPGRSAPEGRTLLQGCNFELRAGERLTLVGESGAGKSLLAQAIMGTLPDVMQASGQVQIANRETNGQRALTQPLWGTQIVMLPQEPWTALNPVMRLRTQVAEAGRYAAGRRWSAALEQADHHLAALGLAHAGRQWLHQISGGMAQRVGVACASQSDARVLLADEPTKGLDAGACEQVAQLLASAQRQGQALLTITLTGSGAYWVDAWPVMHQGSIVETGDVASVLTAPKHPYTQRAHRAAQPRLANDVPILIPGERTKGHRC
ncbi:MAG: ATP-binding cassette domain-containing protein [Burkholderiaceae bacterium]